VYTVINVQVVRLTRTSLMQVTITARRVPVTATVATRLLYNVNVPTDSSATLSTATSSAASVSSTQPMKLNI